METEADHRYMSEETGQGSGVGEEIDTRRQEEFRA